MTKKHWLRIADSVAEGVNTCGTNVRGMSINFRGLLSAEQSEILRLRLKPILSDINNKNVFVVHGGHNCIINKYKFEITSFK